MRRGKSIRGCGSLGILLRIRKGPREHGERLKEQSMKEKAEFGGLFSDLEKSKLVEAMHISNRDCFRKYVLSSCPLLHHLISIRHSTSVHF